MPTANKVVRIIVVPLLNRLENHFDILATHGLETIFDIEEEVCNRLLSNYAEAIGQALNTALTEQNFNQFDSSLKQQEKPTNQTTQQKLNSVSHEKK